MADQRLCGAVHAGIASSATRSKLQSALEDMANELTNNTSYTYEAYGPQDHGWDAPTSPSGKSESEYVKAFLDDVDEKYLNSGSGFTLYEGDTWCIIDALADRGGDSWDQRWGYGRSVKKYSTQWGLYLWGARAAACGETAVINDPDDVTKLFIKHELGHTLGCWHKEGTYSIGSGDNIRDVTPMASAYVRYMSQWGFPTGSDTCYAGSGTTPGVDNNNTFCYGRENAAEDSWCGGCTNRCRHKFGQGNLTGCSINNIESNTPLSDKV